MLNGTKSSDTIGEGQGDIGFGFFFLTITIEQGVIADGKPVEDEIT